MLQDRLFKRHLEDDETVSRIVHRHWIIGAKELALPVVSILIPWVVFFAIRKQPVFGAALIWTGGSMIWLLRNFFDYYLDAWVITNKGVIDLAWLGWFHRQSTRILYSDIQGVSYEIQGILGTLMRFGTVSIEKVSTGAVISLQQVPRPRDVEALILRNMETYMHTKNMKNAKHVQDILSTMIAEQVQMQTMKPLRPEPEPEKETTSAFKTKKVSLRLRKKK